jgi:ribosome maturation factor RimP
VEPREMAGEIAPLLAHSGLDLYDVELVPGILRVTVARPGGVDLDTLAAASETVSHWLDEHDPMPGRYTLEVSSPGLERRLRTPAHFKGAVGETVTLRITPDEGSAERVTGTLQAATDDGVQLSTESGTRSAPYEEVERARTVFAWGSTAKPSPSKGRPARSAASTRGA